MCIHIYIYICYTYIYTRALALYFLRMGWNMSRQPTIVENSVWTCAKGARPLLTAFAWQVLEGHPWKIPRSRKSRALSSWDEITGGWQPQWEQSKQHATWAKWYYALSKWASAHENLWEGLWNGRPSPGLSLSSAGIRQTWCHGVPHLCLCRKALIKMFPYWDCVACAHWSVWCSNVFPCCSQCMDCT